jgi:polyisoprenoid-binding protein YceI
MKNKIFRIAGVHSNIDWIGRKVTGAQYGTIAIEEGTLVSDDGNLTGGNFIVDTTSIKILDVTDPVTNVQFAGHLASADFFASEQFPEALFVITSANPRGNNIYNINGDLTIRGITHPVSFDATVNILDDSLTASGKIVIDRTRYGMKFRSGNFFKDLGDILIYDDFELNVSITAKAIATTSLATANT